MQCNAMKLMHVRSMCVTDAFVKGPWRGHPMCHVGSGRDRERSDRRIGHAAAAAIAARPPARRRRIILHQTNVCDQERSSRPRLVVALAMNPRSRASDSLARGTCKARRGVNVFLLSAPPPARSFRIRRLLDWIGS